MVRKDFMTMDDRLWTPEEWAAWLRYVDAVTGKRICVEILPKDRRNETAVLEQKDSRFVKTDPKP